MSEEAIAVHCLECICRVWGKKCENASKKHTLVLQLSLQTDYGPETRMMFKC